VITITAVNTMQTPNSAEGAKWKFPSRRGVTKTTIFQKHLEKEKISTTDISIKDTKDIREISLKSYIC
jgi:hypothetical protein